MSPADPASNLNLPNALTALRIVLVPFFVWFLWVGGTQGEDSLGMRWAALAVFAVAMYTDKLDGDIARARGLITSFGKIADPIADKLLTGAAFVVLSMLGELWWWVTVVILVREWGITLLRFVVIRYGVMAASKGGKLKTVLQTVALLLLLLPLVPLVGAWWPWLGWIAMGAALVVTVVTGVDYVVKAVQLRRRALAGRNAA
ncbi:MULTISPECIES: CDP-diacylglycerol--glycerol-3-phosphate 3-phosphatidyltransferase [Kocuria]|jgi:CDP-diacylglycerol--glycerol-3-phosphate 3-phosphatidyltransferase|uniref:CDP-diacylglycerol--glycerol-3-phosphate 3-phosphatidyltransferase n=1 Tax=Kocuria rosea subsp. polaris TaxID=136273 RepID=A0A0A6YAX7_KOCRO|nr:MULTISPECIES: CDP-diacylglycerol--glycerol-3-phosphate 3-phosphatidyltransferase [Kocuria]MCC5782791.1 CDP-diacylglycerol--glycerol-3-phosphate 3-phosphatidyltransferase [Kocuria sp. CCUG 69068]EYT52621.1 CDP-diacylglycerol--glycerol-3-phosphate 3-phosphatidyltransferase [Kocuria sp. UCD-OTCP]KHD96502.1 CDP-diacylglycerol--glycerol-3-phosphate 3-phosphatidyltransferase [Kocuria polaris]MCM3486382.1 CDP-diacylglycerol--glycerol-3-phosphate 3-phosphatidyltransferase [Kocuria rosea]MEB2528222.